MSERLPFPDARRIKRTTPVDDEIIILAAGTRIVRVHPLGGTHPCRWNEFRRYGPTKSRFDHHTEPRREHPRRRIAYATYGDSAFCAALAEYFQDDGGGIGPIDTKRNRPAVTAFDLIGDIRTLDLDSGWVTRAGGNQAISSGPRGRARVWARVIYSAHPDIAGLSYGSSIWGPGRCVALWERAERALPGSPLASRTLDDPSIADAVADAAYRLGTTLV